jgi:hypothetical protein
MVQSTVIFAFQYVSKFVCYLSLTKNSGKDVLVHYAIKAYGRVKVNIHAFLTSALAGNEWSASCSERFTPEKEASGTHRI